MDFIWILLIPYWILLIAVACTIFCCCIFGRFEVKGSENSGDQGKLENFTSRNINIKG